MQDCHFLCYIWQYYFTYWLTPRYRISVVPSTTLSSLFVHTYKLLGLIRRTFSSSHHPSVVLFGVLILYEISEKVQKRATMLVKGYEILSYEHRLKSLGVYILFCHHQCGDLIGDLIGDLWNFEWILWHQLHTVFIPSDVISTRGHSLKLFKSHTRLNIHSNFLTQWVIGSWNSLLDEVVTANTIK